jgi:sulfane dehydrogenase subunit SoxC
MAKKKSPRTEKLVSLTTRRRLLQAGLGAAGALVAGPALAADAVTTPDTSKLGPGVDANPYGMPARYEQNVVRRTVSWLTATPQSGVSFTPLQDLDGIVTPSGLCFARHHSGVPDIDPERHRLLIHGMVERPLELGLSDLVRYPSVSRMVFVECPANGSTEWRGAQMPGVQFTHGMIHCCEWTGVKLSTLLAEVGPKRGATWLLVEGGDAGVMARSLPMAKALDDVIVAYSQNGERIRPENGYPLRLIVPGWQGNVNIKWLRRIKLGDQPWHLREETSKYTDLMPDGTARQFTWKIEANSVITAPCPEKPLHDKGRHEIRGLAWSGNGRVRRVDVSFDGGDNWHTAALQQPVLSKCLTRFRLAWDWNGAQAFLQSRVIDETGYVQPTIAELRAVRGVNSIYHNNAVHTWHLLPSGAVRNAQIA